MKTYTTATGIEIGFRAVSKEMLMRFSAANPQPAPPTYSITTATGIVEQIPLDEKSLTEKPEQFTPEQHAEWRAYAEKQAAFIERFIKFFCLRGIAVNAQMDEWIAEQEYLGIPIPENKIEARYSWIVSDVLTTAEDFQAVILGVMESSGVPADLREQVGASFRGEVQRNPDSGIGDATKQVDGEPKPDRSEGDVASALDAKPMGKTKRARPRVGN